MSYKVDIHAAPKQLQEMMEKVLDAAVELSQRLQAVPAGALPAGPAGQTRYMEVTAVGTWTYGGVDIGSNAEGYRTTFWWTGDSWVDNGSVRVKGDTPTGTPTLKPNEVPSGEAVIDFLDKNVKLSGNFVLDQIGTLNISDGAVVPGNTNFRYKKIDLLAGQKIYFGLNVAYNASSQSALLALYDNEGAYINSPIQIKNIPSTQFYEGEYTATVDCKVGLVTNLTISIGEVYANVGDGKIFLEPSDKADNFNPSDDKLVTNEILNKVIFDNAETVVDVPIDITGYFYNDGTINTSTSSYRRSGLEDGLLKNNDEVVFGVNTTTLSSSTSAILNVYKKVGDNFEFFENVIMSKDHLSQFYEGSYKNTTGDDLYFGVSNNNSGTWGTPYLRKKSYKRLLNNNDIGVEVASQQDVNELRSNTNYVPDARFAIKNSSTLLFGGASFMYTANGWVELLCAKLGATAENISYSGEKINNLIYRIVSGTFFTQSILNNAEAFVVMHTHNYDVFTLRDINIDGTPYTAQQLYSFTAEDYDNLSWSAITSSTSWVGTDADYAALWDYFIKKVQVIYYAERLNPSSVYYNTQWGKPFNMAICSHWHDARTRYNESARKLCRKWGIGMIKFDEQIGFSKNMIYASGAQQSVIYALDTEVVDGRTYAWHFVRGQDKPIPQKLAAIASKAFEIVY